MDLLNKKELSEMLKVSMRTVDNLMVKNEIPYIKVGGSVRFDMKDIIKYIDSLKPSR